MKRNFVVIMLIVVLLSGLTLIEGCTDKNSGAKLEQAGKKKDVYYCPMHTQVVSDKPGVCPICHMDLVKKADDAASRADDMDEMVSLSARGLRLADVSTVAVRRETLSPELTAFGTLDFAEPTQKVISAWFNGRIEKLYINATGQNISKGSPLFDVYSPDLVQAQNEYLIALNNNKVQSSVVNGAIKGNGSLAASAKKKLLLMGMTEGQIKQIEASGEPKMTMTYYSPFAGTVIEKRVQEGMYINEGTPIYSVADMSRLWDIVEVYSDNLNSIIVGSQVKIRTQSYPGEEFTGRVSFIYPVVNQESRTVKVRVEVNNNNNRLKPQMYTETVFQAHPRTELVVPENSVLFTGKRNIVWVKADKYMFEPREIKLGLKSNGLYEVLSGINEGDEVASSGAYLIDSEGQLKTGSRTTGHQQSSGGADKKQSAPNSSMPGMPGM